MLLDIIARPIAGKGSKKSAQPQQDLRLAAQPPSRYLLAWTIAAVDQHVVKRLRTALWQLIHLHGLAPFFRLHAHSVPSHDNATVAEFTVAQALADGKLDLRLP
jgi:hypothetical protein